MVAEMEAEIKEWGNSLGVILPKGIAKKENIKAGDKIKLIIIKENPLKDTFGTLKHWKIDSQKMKDELRKEWIKHD